MTVGRTISDLARIHKAGRTDVELFQDELGSSKKHLGDLRMEAWGHEGERAHLAEAYQDQKSPVNELRMEAMADGHWPLAQPSGIKNAAFHADAERIESETLLQDSFTRANGALGSVPGPGDPVAWSVLSGTWAISGNKATETTVAAGAHVAAAVESGAADVAVSADVVLPNSSADAGLVVRAIDDNNYLLLSLYNGGPRWYKRDAGAFTALTGVISGAATANYRVVMKGDRLSVFVDGVFRSDLSITLSAGDYTKYGAATKHGIRENAATANKSTFDNFSVRTLDPQADLAAAVDTFDRSTAAEIIDLSGTRAGGTGTALRLPGITGNYVSTPDKVSLDVAGDLDLRWRMSAESLVPVSFAGIIDKHTSYRVGLDGSNNRFIAYVWDTGLPGWRAYGGPNFTSSGIEANVWYDWRFTLDTDKGGGLSEGRFYRSEDGGETWVQFGSTITTGAFIGPVQNSTSQLGIGIRDGGTCTLKASVASVEVRDGIDGTVVASPDFTNKTAGTTSFNDSQGNLWSINQSHGSIGSTETGEAAALAWVVYGGNSVDNVLRNSRVANISATLGSTNDAGVDCGSTDIDVSADVTLAADQGGGCMIRGTTVFNKHMYLRLTGSATNTLIFGKRDGGTFPVLASVAFPQTSGQTYRVRAVVIGDRLWGYVNGQLLLTYTISGADVAAYTGTHHGYDVLSGGTGIPGLVDNIRLSRPPLVAVWPDLSGKHRHAVQTTLAKQPVLLSNIKNGRAVVRFDGVDDFLSSTGFGTQAQPNTALLAAAHTTATSTQVVFGSASAPASFIWTNASGVQTGFAGAHLAGGTVGTAWKARTYLASGATSRMRMDGVQQIIGNTGTQGWDGARIGADSGGAALTHGDVGEAVLANADLEATGELTAAENYLIRRWT